MEKLTYNNVIESIGMIHMSPGGVEYIASEDYDGKMDFVSKSGHRDYYVDQDYTKQEIKEKMQMYRDANKHLALWKKGLRRLIKIAKKGQGAMDKMANAYTGNGPKNNIEYFWKLYRMIDGDDLIKMGEDKNSFPMITSYVDGSFDYYLK